MKMSKESIAGKKEFRQKLLALVLPITIQQFMLALVSASDAVMLGLVDQDSLSAVSLAAQIAFIESLFLMAMTIGQSILVAQYYGKKDMVMVRRISRYVLKLTVVVALIFSMLALFCPGILMRIFTQDERLIAGGVSYLRTVSLSYLLTGISQIYLCLLKNCGMAGRASLISSTSVIVNILLNAVLILGLFGMPRLEIVGAAIATLIARSIEVVWSVWETIRKKELNLLKNLSKRTEALIRKQFWKYTTPVLCNEIVWGTGFSMFSVIMGHLGSDAVAANSLTTIVKNLVACFCNGLGTGAGILVGNELGAGNLEKAREYGRRLCHLAIGSGALSGLVILMVTPLILQFVNLTPQSTEYLKWMLVMCSYYMIGKSVNSTTIAGIFCAGGDSRFGLLCDLITMWVIIVPLGLLAAFVWKLPVVAVCVILNMDEMIKMPAVYYNYRKYRWVKDLTKEQTT